MKIGRHRTAIVLLFFVVLCSASLMILSTKKDSVVIGPVTGEEAREISKSASLVIDGLANSSASGLDEVNYYNFSMVENLKESHESGMYDEVPQGHAIWEVIWHFQKGAQGTYLVIVIIDAETGAIVHEETGALFL
jgi:hypothetical protein